MKAKEYLAKFDADCWDTDEKTAAYNLILEFMEELPSLLKMRNAKSNGATKAIIRELNQKWNAMCRLDKENRFKRNGFIIFLKARIEKEGPSKEKFMTISFLDDIAGEFRGE